MTVEADEPRKWWKYTTAERMAILKSANETSLDERAVDGATDSRDARDTDVADDPHDLPGHDARQAQIETVLAAWRVWRGTFSAFCTHVRRDHRLERAWLAACEGRVGSLHQPQLLGRGELAPHLGRHRLLRRVVHAGLTLLALAPCGGAFSTWNLGWLGHVWGTILRPSVQRYRGGTVSGDVGTEGATTIAPSDAAPVCVRSEYLYSKPVRQDLCEHAPSCSRRQALTW
jgi:hypothetical protein